MEALQIRRLDHLGIIAGTIKDLGIIEMIDARIPSDKQEAITCGEAVAGMILNGLGFSQRPMTLTPQFFVNKPLEVLLRPGVKAEDFNRFKLGRSLEDLYHYGASALFEEIAAEACRREAVETRYTHGDTTSFSLTGEYDRECDQQALRLTYGYSKDHRPDLKQAVLELLVAQDGGVPLACRSWDGNQSDDLIFRQRAQQLIEVFGRSPLPRYLILDSKGYSEANAENLRHLPLIVAVPATLKLVEQIIRQALASNTWQAWDKQHRYQSFDLCHYHIPQRWVVVYSQAAFHQAAKSLEKQRQKEKVALDKALFHLQAQRFSCEADARAALAALSKTWKLHRLQAVELIKHKRYAKTGQPTAQTPVRSVQWQIRAQVETDLERLEERQRPQACYVLAASLQPEPLEPSEIIRVYKAQNTTVERGFRFLKEPIFFVSSLFLKKPERIEGLLMMMTLALLVYSIAQRRLRQALAAQKRTWPNQIGKPTTRPTLRWIFQCLEGIHLVSVTINGTTQIFIDGLSPERTSILCLFGDSVKRIYQIPSG